eukprot:Awhi_evm1s15055
MLLSSSIVLSYCLHLAVVNSRSYIGNGWFNGLAATHYWDCNGQGCDAGTLQPWDINKYISSPIYSPQIPSTSHYGEVLWMTGAMSDVLAELMEEFDHSRETCCGISNGDNKACGKCLLISNPDSERPDWTAVVMKKNRCPPHTHGCEAGNAHLDLAVPGFDNLQYSTANVCGLRANTMTKAQSSLFGTWYYEGKLSNQVDKCIQLPEEYRNGCRKFVEWGWHTGNPRNIQYKPVECPSEFKAMIGSAFDRNGLTGKTSTEGPSPGKGSSGGNRKKGCSNKQLSQCSGLNFNGETCCPTNTVCVETNPYWSDCQPVTGSGRSCSNLELSQCGGKNFFGETCCPANTKCVKANDYWSDCQPRSGSGTGEECLNLVLSQCGGKNFFGETCCPANTECVRANDYWSDCQPRSGSGEGCSNLVLSQCGGKNFFGEVCCPADTKCTRANDYWSDCQPVSVSGSGEQCSNSHLSQCGGRNFYGETCCPAKTRCVYANAFWSDCQFV